MGFTTILGMMGGLALFLHGMQMMSSGLEAAAGEKMKLILKKLTANRFLGVLVGALITAVIQSSSATTVMTVGFVSAGMMTLNQAVWIIMGANIGTTVTGLLVALDVGILAPICAFIGVVLMVFVKKPQLQHIGQILAGLGVLFIGMDMMSSSMAPLRDSAAFTGLMSTFSNPVLGILAGTVFTAVIQSSSASVGILQALANSGAIAYGNSVYVLFGQNIGTCITAVLAAVGASRDAKRTTVIHLMFNVIGTVLFTLLFLLFPIAQVISGELILPGALGQFLSGFLPGTPAGQIALTHTCFNILTTLLLLPLGNYLAKISVLLLPEIPCEGDCAMHLEYLKPIHTTGKEGGLGGSAIYISQLEHELHRMLTMAQENVAASFSAVLARDASQLEDIDKREDYIDYLNKEISLHVSKLIVVETNEKASAAISSCFTMSGNIERISDHAVNLAGYTRALLRLDAHFSEAALTEISQMRELSLDCVNALSLDNAGTTEWMEEVAMREQRIDDLTDAFRRNQLERMRTGFCSEEACILYSELLTDFERIGDHVMNIAEEQYANMTRT